MNRIDAMRYEMKSVAIFCGIITTGRMSLSFENLKCVTTTDFLRSTDVNQIEANRTKLQKNKRIMVF
jgi:hypothetical protein